MTLRQASSLKSPCFVNTGSQIKGASSEAALRWGARGVVQFLPGYWMWDLLTHYLCPAVTGRYMHSHSC